MKRFASVLGVLACVLPASACLRMETAHVLYLSPDGEVTWTVREHDVHSDEQDPAKRAPEEADFVRAVQEGRNEPLLALEALGGRDVTTELTRTDRPWEALTSARFDRAARLAAGILGELQIAGSARQVASGDRITLTVEWTSDGDTAAESPVLALIEDLEAYRIVLTEGRFVASEGFRISPDGRTAVPLEQTRAPGAPWRISLTWVSASPGRR
jgi:hypothetical protein